MEIHLVLSAARFAAEKHAAQKRKGEANEPYINHLLEVAELVSGAISESDIPLVMAALLHDTIEDTDTTQEELAEQFGSDVAYLVAEVTDDRSLTKAERKRLQIETAPRKSVRAQAIKLADKISNVRSILTSPPVGWDAERRREYIEWAKQVVDALSSPNVILKAEFDRVYGKFGELW